MYSDSVMPDVREKPVPPAWVGPLNAWAAWMVAAGRSSTTIRTRSDHVRRLARGLGASPAEATPAAVLGWVAGQSWARETRRSMYCSIRGFFDWAVAAGVVASSPACSLPTIGAGEPAPRPCPDTVLAEARGRADARTGLMLRLAAEAGLRRAEIARIHARDVVEDLVGWSLVVHGKGAKVRTVPLSRSLARDVVDAVAAGGGYAFPGNDAGHLSAQYVGKLIARALDAEGWTAHTLRHRFSTRAYTATGDLLAVSRLLGHASVATTQRYVATEARRLREVAEAAA